MTSKIVIYFFLIFDHILLILMAFLTLIVRKLLTGFTVLAVF